RAIASKAEQQQRRKRMLKPVRRVVTGHDTHGRSIFVMDGPSPAVFTRGTGSTSSTVLWETRATPADNSGNADTVGAEHRLPPPPNGSCFRIVDYPPDKERIAALRATATREAAHARGEGYVRDTGNARHPGFHKTNTIDYAIVLEGEIWALMDQGE